MRNIKYLKISKDDIEKSLFVNKVMSQSLEKPLIIIKQFNALTPNKRIEISKEWLIREEKLKSTIKTVDEDIYITCIMIELNIIASKYDIDPATVCMCINPPCKCNQKIIVK